MKRLLLIISGLFLVSGLYAQQLPLSENYFVDKYTLSSAYAGNSENSVLFANYRRDWSSVIGSPQTIRLSYHGSLNKFNSGFGGKLILDEYGIFQSFYGMATFSYRVKVTTDQFINFGLSAGIHQNWINFSDYYNDPNFNADIAMINKDIKSDVNLVSDVSLLYTSNRFHAGVLFSNISYSEYTYQYVKATYYPFFYSQVHAIYTIPFQGSWQAVPLVIYRKEKGIAPQMEFGAQLKYREKMWGTLGHRGKNIFSTGFGINTGKGLIFNYNFNFFSGIGLSKYQNHEVTVGLKLSEFFPEKKEVVKDKDLSASR